MTEHQQDLVKLSDLVAHQAQAIVCCRLSARTLQSVVQLTVILESIEQLKTSLVPAMIPLNFLGVSCCNAEYYTDAAAALAQQHGAG